MTLRTLLAKLIDHASPDQLDEEVAVTIASYDGTADGRMTRSRQVPIDFLRMISRPNVEIVIDQRTLAAAKTRWEA